MKEGKTMGEKMTRTWDAFGIGLSVLILLLAFPSVMRAQQGFGSVVGTVTDPQGAAVKDAEVVVVGDQTGVRLTTQSGDSGLFKITQLLPGPYTIQIRKVGFDTADVKEVSVRPNATATVDVVLKVGRESTTITVTAELQAIDKTSTAVSVEMDKDLIENIPYTERNSLSVVMLSPEVVGDMLSGAGGVASENPGVYTGYVAPGAALSIGGALMGRSSLLVDGSDVTQTSFPRAGLTVSGQLSAGTTVISSGLPAQYGRTMVGIAATTTRSGTSQYHGSVKYDYASNFMEAKGWGSTWPVDLHRSFWGFYLGGPVRIPHLYNGKNRTFFYVGIEPADLRSTAYSNASIPTEDELNGKFANSLGFLNSSILSTQGYVAALAAARTGHIYYQYPLNSNGFPAGARYGSSTQYVQIPNDDVSAQATQNPLSLYIKSQLPTPSKPGPYVHYYYSDGYWTNAGYNAQLYRISYNKDRRWSLRGDHVVSDRDRIFVRFSSAPLSQQRVFALALTSPFQSNPSDNATAYDGSMNETHVFTSNLVNTFKAMYMRNEQTRIPDSIVTSKDWASQFNLPAPLYGVGFPYITLGYGINLGYQSFNRQVDQTYQIGDDLSWIHGHHMIMVGLDLRLLRSKQLDESNAYGGNMGFTGLTNNGSSGGNSLAQLDLGEIASYSASATEVPSYYFWHYYGAYVQDSYRIKPSLTLSLGVRYEIETPRMEKFDNQGSFVSGQLATLNTGTSMPGAFCLAEACGLKKSLWPTNHMGIEPRIGLIWSPSKNFAVQAGYALTRAPLTGYSYVPTPNMNASATTVNGDNGGVNTAWGPNFITNPLATLSSKGTYFTQNPAKVYAYVPSSFGVNYVDQSNKVPYASSWNFGFQYQFKDHSLIKAGYNGLLGENLVSSNAFAINTPTLSKIQSLIAAGTNFNSTSNNTLGITSAYPATTGSILAESIVQKLYPYQNFFNSPLTELFNRSGRSTYHALYISASHPVGYGFNATAGFTWSKSMDNMGVDFTSAQLTGNGTGSRQNPFLVGGDRSLSSQDLPVRLNVGFTELIPVGKNQLIPISNKILVAVLGGWRVGGMLAQSGGWPIRVGLGGSGWWNSFTSNGKGGYAANGTLVPTGASLLPDIVPGTSCYAAGDWQHYPSKYPYLNVNHFAMPGGNAAGTPGTPVFGNARRFMGDCRSPRSFQLDANGGKSISLGHGRSLSLSVTASNVLNHPVKFATANANGSPFGSVNSAWLTNPGGNTPFTTSTGFGYLSTGNIPTRFVLLNMRLGF